MKFHDALALALALSPLGCASYTFGPAPAAPPPSASPVERCIAQKQLTLSRASGNAQLLNETSGSGGYIYVRKRSVSGEGYTFFRGQDRLEVDEGLRELGDPSLAEAERRAQRELSGAKTRQTLSRPLWIALMAGGVALSLVGIATIRGDDGKLNSSTLAILGAGVGAEIVALPFMYMDYTSDAAAAAYDMRGKIYMPNASDSERLAAALAAQRARSERACGAAAPP
jgi:hypothetical protein